MPAKSDSPNEASKLQVPSGIDKLSPEQAIVALQLQRARRDAIPRWRVYAGVAILFTCNFLNYADRYTLSAVLPGLQSCFSIGDTDGGLAISVFTISYMIVSPAFGYLGDRFDRRPLLAVGIFIWCLAVLASSLVPCDWPYIVFLVFRSLCGIGEASYVTVAPTIISDLFAKETRSKVLMLFYFAIPVGTGFGFAIGAFVSSYFDNWAAGMRVTPILGLLTLPLIIFVLPEPPRGLAEAEKDIFEGDTGRAPMTLSSFFEDLKHLLFNKSYMLSLVAYTMYVFAVGAFTQWAPIAAIYGQQIQDPDTEWKTLAPALFGVVTMLAGLFGVAAGGYLSVFWKRYNGAADPLICGYSGLLAVPCLYLAIVFLTDLMAVWFFVFFGVCFLCFYWSVAMDFLMYIVIPERRSTAAAIQILVSHGLGDAISSLIVGAISDAERGDQRSYAAHFYALKNALYLPVFLVALGGGFFLFSSWFVEADKARADMETKANRNVRVRSLVSSTIQLRKESMSKEASGERVTRKN